MGAEAKRLKVLCFSVYPYLGPSVRHRIFSYQHLLRQQNIDLTVYSLISESLYRQRRRFGLLATLYKLTSLLCAVVLLFIKVMQVWRYDVIVIHREAFPLGPPIFEKLIYYMNSNIIFDLDDAIWDPPSFEVDQRKLLWDPRRVEKVMRMSKVVIAGNQYIADYANQYCDQVEIIPTVFENNYSKPDDLQQRQTESTVRLLWIGGLGNAVYLERLTTILRELDTKHDFELLLVGGEDIYDLDFPDTFCKRQLWTADAERAALTKSDIGLMPLVNKKFELGKCAFKIIQYFSAYMPVVASPVGMNEEVVKDNNNGFLADTEQQWKQSLEALIEDRELRKHMALNARNDYEQRFKPSVQVLNWEKVIRGIAK